MAKKRFPEAASGTYHRTLTPPGVFLLRMAIFLALIGFLAAILQFQFYKAAADQVGWKGPLHRCSFYGNKEVGAKFAKMMEMGASKPWPDALEAFTGTREMSGKAMMSTP